MFIVTLPQILSNVYQIKGFVCLFVLFLYFKKESPEKEFLLNCLIRCTFYI